MKQNSPYFSIERDKTYPFFCEVCIVGKPETEMSQDNRYCHNCYDILLKEVEMDTSRRDADWKPKRLVIKHEIAPLETAQVSMGMHKEKGVLLHTKMESNHAYQNPTEDRPKVNLGGRPRKDIPIDLIRKFSKEGLSIGQIVRELKGKKISAMTISRVLSGERK